MHRNAQHTARMPIPSPVTAIFTTIPVLIIPLFTVLAVYNLTYFTTLTCFGIVASVIWLLLMVTTTWSCIRSEGGIHQQLVDILGNYSRNHFVEVANDDDGQTAARFGYEFWGRNFLYCSIKLDDAASVSWSTGQATAMAGCDMNDWTVALRYHDPDRSGLADFPGPHQYQTCYIVGPSRAKEKTEALGLEFVAFLRDAGIDLLPTDKDNEFTVCGREQAKDASSH